MKRFRSPNPATRRKQRYTEGDWIAVPLGGGGFAAGLVARSDGRGTILVYLFGPATASPPRIEELRERRADEAVLVGRAGDLGLTKGNWLVLGRLEGWNRSAWPVPVFIRRDAISGRPAKVMYREPELFTEVELLRCSEDEARGLPEDGLMGAGFVELRLTKMLGTR